jgi:hypothetical protein
MRKSARIIGVLAFLHLVGTFALAQAREIIVYGQNTPEWNKALGATATRSACNSTPEGCMKTVAALLQGQHTSRFYLNLWDDPKVIAENAAQYSKFSLEEPRLHELDIDDFADHFTGWCRSLRCEDLLRQVIENTKSKNRNLKFGITIYEDQLSGLLANPRFTPDLRKRIDTVHLFFHTRSNGPNFEAYLKQIKQNFPNARVIGGSYPYDRIDYEKSRNSTAEERDLQKRTLRVETRLLSEDAIAGVEFYPGHFGMEERLTLWNDPHECKPERKQACIENTKAMHNDAEMLLRAAER